MGLLYLMGESVFNPRTLFANGEQGLWLDPSDFSTMWQDAAGDTPVTAASDPVALILDKSRSGPNMGSNQVTNGGFGADSDWTKGTGWTIGSGVATKTAGSASLLSQAQTMTAGRYCIVTYTITRTAGSITPQFAGGTTVSGTARSTSGTFTDIMTVVSGNNTLQFSADASFAGTVDNVSLKELSAGNHAYQTTSGQRPTLARIPSSGRRNLLTRTEEFDNNSIWAKDASSATANATTAPDGTLTADRLVPDNTSNVHRFRGLLATSSVAHVVSFYAKAGEISKIAYREGVTTGAFASFDLSNGTVINQGTGGTGSITSAGNGWYRCSVSFTAGATTRIDIIALPNTFSAGDSPITNYTFNGTDGVFVWGAQLETGSSATNYQKVVATTDVTESGVGNLWHLVFDGSDDSLVTNSVDFSATDEMTVIAGVRKLSDAARGTVCELTATSASNNGAFHLTAPNAASATYAFESKGTALTDAVASSVTAPLTSVISGSSDISGDSNVIRVNGSQSDSDTGDQGTGNYSNAILYIGRRGSSSLPFNGHIYQLIVRGKTTPTGKLLEAEKFVSKKTGVNL